MSVIPTRPGDRLAANDWDRKRADNGNAGASDFAALFGAAWLQQTAGATPVNPATVQTEGTLAGSQSATVRSESAANATVTERLSDKPPETGERTTPPPLRNGRVTTQSSNPESQGNGTNGQAATGNANARQSETERTGDTPANTPNTDAAVARRLSRLPRHSGAAQSQSGRPDTRLQAQAATGETAASQRRVGMVGDGGRVRDRIAVEDNPTSTGTSLRTNTSANDAPAAIPNPALVNGTAQATGGADGQLPEGMVRSTPSTDAPTPSDTTGSGAQRSHAADTLTAGAAQALSASQGVASASTPLRTASAATASPAGRDVPVADASIAESFAGTHPGNTDTTAANNSVLLKKPQAAAAGSDPEAKLAAPGQPGTTAPTNTLFSRSESTLTPGSTGATASASATPSAPATPAGSTARDAGRTVLTETATAIAEGLNRPDVRSSREFAGAVQTLPNSVSSATTASVSTPATPANTSAVPGNSNGLPSAETRVNPDGNGAERTVSRARTSGTLQAAEPRSATLSVSGQTNATAPLTQQAIEALSMRSDNSLQISMTGVPVTGNTDNLASQSSIADGVNPASAFAFNGLNAFQKMAADEDTPRLVMSTPITDPGFADELHDTVQLVSTRGLQSIEISITPAELGPIKLKVDMTGNQAEVRFEAAQEATRTLLADAVPALKEQLAQSGIDLRHASIEQNQNPREGSQSNLAGQSWQGSAQQDARQQTGQQGFGERGQRGLRDDATTAGKATETGIGTAGNTAGANRSRSNLLDTYA